MTGVVDVLAAAAEVAAVCGKRGWRYRFIGGVAVPRWGNPRFTVDVDLTLITGYGGEEAFIDALRAELTGCAAERELAVGFSVPFDARLISARTRGNMRVWTALKTELEALCVPCHSIYPF